MRYSDLEKSERQFQQTKRAVGREFELEPFSLKVPEDENLTLEGYTCRPANGYSGYFEAQKVDKEAIVMHFTVGHLQSDIHVLTKPKAGQKKWRLSVAFVIGRDGTIYQLHSSAHWSHHLGKDAYGGNSDMSKRTIGIELCNYGPLKKVNNNLETAYSRPKKNPGRTDVYCTMDDRDQYIQLDTPYRGYTYFATFTDEQYESLIVLLRYLTATYEIPRAFIPEPERYQANWAHTRFKGILTHVNFRSSGKVDFGPAFDWDRLIKGVQGETYGVVSEEEAEVLAAKRTVRQAEQRLQNAKEREDEAIDLRLRSSNKLAEALNKVEHYKNAIEEAEREMGIAAHEVDKAQAMLEEARDKLQNTLSNIS